MDSSWRRHAARFAVPALVLAGLAAAPAAAADERPDFVIAVFGDSYASGEGSPDKDGRHDVGGGFALCPFDGPEDDPNNPNDCHADVWWAESSPVRFPQGDDAGWATETTRCHRSSEATAPQAAMRIQERFPNVEVIVLNFACSGAEIGAGLLQPDDGTEPALKAGPLLKPQVQALEDYVDATGHKVDALIMNIGGNDALFEDVATACLVGITSCADNQDVRDKVAARLGPGSGAPSPAAATVADRFLALDRAIDGLGTGPRLISARPAEVYETSVPNPSRGAAGGGTGANPLNFCDGSQTNDIPYSFISRSEAEFVEQTAASMNAAFSAASQAHGWIFVPGIFPASQNRGLCAGASTWFRTNGDALRIQGNDLPAFTLPFGIGVAPLPFMSSGLAHPNTEGYRQMGNQVADVVEEQVRMRFTAPVLRLDTVQVGDAFTVAWPDPSPLHAPETRWELELSSPGSATAHLFTDGADAVHGTQAAFGSTTFWRVPRTGDFTVRVRGCRPNNYCGPYSNAVQATTSLGGTPTDLRRVVAVKGLASSTIRVVWTPAPNTPASATWQVRHQRRGVFCGGQTLGGHPVCIMNGFVDGAVATVGTPSFQLGSALLPLDPDDTYAFEVRTCTSAGCSPYTPMLIVPVQPALTPVGQIGMRSPRAARAGTTTPLELTWRTPRRWTDLRHVDLHVVARGQRVGRIRFAEKTGVLTVDGAGAPANGRGEEERTITSGALGLDLAATSVVRFGPQARQVVLRLGLVAAASLRGRTLVLEAGATDDRGHVQRPQPVAVLRVRG